MTSETMKNKREPVWMLFFGLALIVWTLVGICLPQPKSGEPVAILTAASKPNDLMMRVLHADKDTALLNIYAGGRVIVVYPEQLDTVYAALRGTPSIAINAALVGCGT